MSKQDDGDADDDGDDTMTMMTVILQVGKVDLDHSYWGRPEDMTMDRPVYKLTTSRPGSDLAGETAAAFAAGYLAFRDTGQSIRQLVSHLVSQSVSHPISRLFSQFVSE